jgi:hypothetical protein
LKVLDFNRSRPCVHKKPPDSCEHCWPEVVVARLEAQVQKLEAANRVLAEDNSRLVVQLAEQFRKASAALIQVGEMMEGKP